MIESYRTVYEGKQGEIEEKKSRFIASVAHVETEEEAVSFIEATRKRYYDARHNCYAYCLGKKGDQMRCSDDGEPSQTAGKPMLDVIVGQQLCDTVVVVTRYFGGTLLGTGGLVRAYTAATQEGLRNSVIIEKKLADQLWVTVDYNGIGKLLYLIGQKGYTQLDSDYGEQVTLVILVPVQESERFQNELVECFSGKAGISVEGQIWYAKIEKELVLFEN
ncbi:MAG: YigZ family protein [Lachnospiraceae bacterium]|nr:YigZ family protein [Lachnospiraceae bacterium]